MYTIPTDDNTLLIARNTTSITKQYKQKIICSLLSGTLQVSQNNTNIWQYVTYCPEHYKYHKTIQTEDNMFLISRNTTSITKQYKQRIMCSLLPWTLQVSQNNTNRWQYVPYCPEHYKYHKTIPTEDNMFLIARNATSITKQYQKW